MLALGILLAMGVWVFLEYQKFAQVQDQVFEENMVEVLSEPTPSPSTLDESSAATQPEPVNEAEASLPADWITQEYSSNGQVVWQLAHPADTTVTQAGLPEGTLELQSSWNGARFATQLSYPLFDQGLPATLDQWVTDFVTTENDLAGDVIVEKGMADGVLIRIVKNGALTSANRQTPTPATLVFIWSYTTDTGETKNPALITIRQLDSGDRQVEAFAEVFVAGLNFQR